MSGSPLSAVPFLAGAETPRAGEGLVSIRQTVAAAATRAMPQAKPSGIAGGDADLEAGAASERGEAGPGANNELTGEGANPAVAWALAPALPKLKPPWA